MGFITLSDGFDAMLPGLPAADGEVADRICYTTVADAFPVAVLCGAFLFLVKNRTEAGGDFCQLIFLPQYSQSC